MTFEEILDQAMAMLQRRGRVTYRTLKRQFDLDDAALEDLKAEILYAHPQVVDDKGQGLIWSRKAEVTSETTPPLSHLTLQPVTQEVPHTPSASLLPKPYTPDAERRQLTVLFCDLVDSTKLAGQLDPEDLREVIRAYHAICTEVIQRFDGYIAQYLGDGLLVYFGYPQAHEDDAQRAVRTGLGIVDALGILNTRLERERGVKLAVRVGIHTGLVVVGEIGGEARREQLALGETPNIAARVQSLAHPDTVVLSAATHRLVQGYFLTEDRGSHSLKGIPQPMTIYRVLHASGVQSRLELASVGGLTPLVGRERELALLQDRFAEVQSGRGQAVFLVGEAGIGKSRLSLEFRRYAEAAGARWLLGRCVSYGHGMTYLPVLDLVRNLFALQEADSLETIGTKIASGVRQIGEELIWTIPFMRALLSLDPGDPEVVTMTPLQRRGRIGEALRVLMIQASSHQPVVLVVEDLHWIDPHSEEVIRLWLEGIAAVPLLVLLTYRPGYPAPFGDQTYYTRMPLHRLPEAQMGTMVEGVLHSAEIPPTVRELIAQKAEGNPLFIEELSKALVEEGTLQRVNGGYQLTRPLNAVVLPGTIQGVIMARIDRLPEAAKSALQVAAVIGREFTARLVERVSAMEHEVTHVLGELRAVELIYEKTLYPELAYMFKHALTHDVAYDSLLRQQRKTLHRRAGAVIEELYTERLPEFYEVLAWHYVQGEMWPKAVDYLLKAADQARAQFAYPQATHYCIQASAILEQHSATTAEKVQAFEKLGDFQSLQGSVELANQAYERALEVVDEPTTRQRIVNKRHRPGIAVRDGITIAYYEHGSGEPTLLFMHPLVYGLQTYQPVVELLCQEFRIVTVDPRGVGGSDPIPEVYRMSDHVEDARAVIEAIGSQPVVFVGLSSAAALGINVAARYPHLVQRLILVGAKPAPPGVIHFPVPGGREWWQQYVALIQAGEYEQAMRLFASVASAPEPGLRNRIEGFVQAARELPGAVFRNFSTEGDPDLRPLLPTLQLPTLVLHGEEDHLESVEGGRYVADHIPGAQFYVFKGRCHNPVVTATAEFAQVVRNFIRTGRARGDATGAVCG